MEDKKLVRLYQAQKAFLDSRALYRAFCAGIGAGKSWAGSYDLIRRAKPGRLYLVLAPTYPMLSDSSFRSFLSVATELGLAEPGDVKKSAPPSIRLLTGAEVLFRSADDPERIRGPNLSGVWMDEASLMHVDAFNVAIGRLRQGGEQGWLSATFTPKGRQHWTFEQFASGRPNTEMFRARTSDNPFLPADFHGTLRQQYTSRLAAQELEGEFTEVVGAMFRRSWFSIVDVAPGEMRLLRWWDLAGTEKTAEKASDPDYTAGVLMGKAKDNRYYILDVRRQRSTPRDVQNLVRQTAELDGRDVAVWMEQEPGSSGVSVIDHYVRNVLQGFNFHGERSTGDKATRAQPFAAQAEAGNVMLVRGAWNKDFLDEVEVFPFGVHDDATDAAAAAFMKLALTIKRRLWAG